jgi:hypothetical protein
MPDIEDQIQKAIKDGQFTDLSGKGKPLNLDEDAQTDPEWRLAHHMIKSSGFTLPWIEKRQAILDALEQSRQGLVQGWAWRNEALTQKQPFTFVNTEWQRKLDAFKQQIQELNKRILSYNLEAPSSQFQLPQINVEREIARITS